jgi:N-acetylglucosamine-6-phosphate deacetylase
MGHTAATYAEAAAGFRAGVSSATHTFNAMRGLHHREPGALGAALAHDEIIPELIYDRVHVSAPSAGILLRSLPMQPDAPEMRKVAAVSDCTMAAGLAPGTELDMWGIKVLTAEGEVRLKETGALAGSAATLADCFQRLSEDFHPLTAIQACSIVPREVLGPRLPVRTWLELDLPSRELHVHRVSGEG